VKTTQTREFRRMPLQSSAEKNATSPYATHFLLPPCAHIGTERDRRPVNV